MRRDVNPMHLCPKAPGTFQSEQRIGLASRCIDGDGVGDSGSGALRCAVD